MLHGEKMSGSDGMVFDANGRLFFGVFDYVRCVCVAVWLCGCVAFCSCVCVCVYVSNRAHRVACLA